jgi:hypothetical protein
MFMACWFGLRVVFEGLEASVALQGDSIHSTPTREKIDQMMQEHGSNVAKFTGFLRILRLFAAKQTVGETTDYSVAAKSISLSSGDDIARAPWWFCSATHSIPL